MTYSRSKKSIRLSWVSALLATALLSAPAFGAGPSRLDAASDLRVAAATASDRDTVPRTSSAISSSDIETIEVDRNGDELRDEIRPRPTDVDITDTALVFTNRSHKVVKVRCISRTQDGAIIGQATTTVPAYGLRYIRASDFSEGRDYVGSAACKSNGRVVSGAILFGEEITQLNSDSRRRGRGMAHFFPVVVTY